jgi:23S rRNA pseudouridine2605 synthase
VTVDGAPAVIGQKVDPAIANVAIDGVTLPVRPDLVYFLVFKPQGMVSTADDPQGRPIVTDLFPGSERVYPVGRLDADSEGLLLLTNDGDLTFRLSHPRFGVEKTYVVLVERAPSKAVLGRLRRGVELEDGRAHAARVGVLDETPSGALVQVVMTEGRKREVRRMFDAVGHPVLRLVRTAIGPLRDRDLEPGTGRYLDIDEVRDLYAAAAAPEDQA